MKDRGQRSEVGGQWEEGMEQETEIRHQRSEVSGKRSVGRRHGKTEVEERGQKKRRQRSGVDFNSGVGSQPRL
jgi:hypothetical protein